MFPEEMEVENEASLLVDLQYIHRNFVETHREARLSGTPQQNLKIVHLLI